MESQTKNKYRKIIRWLLVDIAVACTIFALLFYRPSRYKPLKANINSTENKRVHPYLTNLSSELYNGVQKEKPFELVVLEEGINEAISRSKWPMEAEGVRFLTPVVLFVPDNIILMGTADIRGAEFIVTIVLEPVIGDRGFLNLQVAKIKIGAMNITPLAKIMAKKMYQDRISNVPVDIEDVRTKVAASLLNDEPFEPVFKFDDKKVRLERIVISQGKLILYLIPI